MVKNIRFTLNIDKSFSIWLVLTLFSDNYILFKPYHPSSVFHNTLCVIVWSGLTHILYNLSMQNIIIVNWYSIYRVMHLKVMCCWHFQFISLIWSSIIWILSTCMYECCGVLEICRVCISILYLRWWRCGSSIEWFTIIIEFWLLLFADHIFTLFSIFNHWKCFWSEWIRCNRTFAITYDNLKPLSWKFTLVWVT